MPTITVSRKEFEKLVGKKLSDEKLKERISLLGTDLEEVNKDSITVEVFPNRPDMLSLQGFARAFATFIGAKEGLAKFKVEKSGEKVVIGKSVKNVRPYTACAIVKGMKFDDEKIIETIQIQEKLHITFGRNRRKVAIGIYPYEKIKPPITFKAMDPDKIKFRPLEHDEEITGNRILSQTATGREYAHLLEGYSKYPVFVDSEDKILSMPPIINSHDTGKISEKTKDVFIECSGFDFKTLNKCLNMIVTAFADMGGNIYSMELVYPDKKETTPDLTPSKIRLDADYINKHLGLDLTKKQLQALLLKMGHGAEKSNILIPAYRADIMHQVDLAEDIAIAYGFENFEAQIPNVATVGEEARASRLKNLIADILTGLGFLELNTYNLIGKEKQTKMMELESKPVEVENSLSAGYDSVREWMVPSIMEVFRGNRNAEYPQKIFDVDTVFLADKSKKTGVNEKQKLAAGICHEKANYTEIKQALDYLMRMLNIKYEIKEKGHPSFIEGRCGKVIIEGKEAGFLGEINPKVLENFELLSPVAAMELDINGILKI